MDIVKSYVRYAVITIIAIVGIINQSDLFGKSTVGDNFNISLLSIHFYSQQSVQVISGIFLIWACPSLFRGARSAPRNNLRSGYTLLLLVAPPLRSGAPAGYPLLSLTRIQGQDICQMVWG
jgi:hypothetical protein